MQWPEARRAHRPHQRTAATGAILYEPLNRVRPTAHLPEPPVCLVSIGALSVNDSKDQALHDTIDVIKNAVLERSDIKVYNVSFEPSDPVLDDRISRFTYALDNLAFKYNATFFVAVGNDAETPRHKRSQAPCDLVHGMGVDAFMLADAEPMAASYPCRGPARRWTARGIRAMIHYLC